MIESTVKNRFHEWTIRRADFLRRLSIVVTLLSFLAILWAMPVKPVAEALQSRTQQADVWDAAKFAGLFVVFTVCFIPVWPMPFVAGAMFGTLQGTGLASASCVGGAAATFLLARMLGQTSLRDSVKSSPRMRALAKTVQAGDWKIVAAVRLSHFMTFGMQNYAFGFTRIRFSTFLFTTWAVTLPGTLLQSYLGHLGFASVDAWRAESMLGWQSWAMQIAGLCIIAAAVIYIAHRGRTVYRQAYKAQLEKDVETETSATDERGGWPWRTLLCCVASIAICAFAVWSVVERNTLRDYVERQLLARIDTTQS